ncbi:hypothetical protein N5U26_05420 [Aliarcobacter cryaerophilus]|uniref:hypothetical protein n=1 Tax=Aliarcobacter cryaerophilus TaxID=28198 RepID=UPI0021B69CDF|nr:hypothetical protein [Aliarcobacter cryaerophilus]MCT7509784.1 hypothetical protein [Aliarcobacter cryaerophilus]
MLNTIRNDFRARINTNNFYMGILFIILLLCSLYTLDLNIYKNQMFILLSEKLEKSIMEISIIESIILVFIINIIGYIINFLIKSIYSFYENIVIVFIKKIFTFIPSKFVQSIFKSKKKNIISASERLINIALSYNPTLLDININQHAKLNMAKLYLILFIKSKNESLYQEWINHFQKYRFYQNAISLILFFFLYTSTLAYIIPSYIGYEIKNQSSISNEIINNKYTEITSNSQTIKNKQIEFDIKLFAIILLVVIILTIIIHITYKQSKEKIEQDLLVFIAILNTKIE